MKVNQILQLIALGTIISSAYCGEHCTHCDLIEKCKNSKFAPSAGETTDLSRLDMDENDWSNLSTCLGISGDYQGCIIAARTSLAFPHPQNPGFTNTLRNLINCQVRLRKWNDCMETADMIKSSPYAEEIHSYAGEIGDHCRTAMQQRDEL